MRLAVLTLFCFLYLPGCCKKCPPPQPPLPPKVVEVKRPCMDPPPVFIIPRLPSPEFDGVLHISPTEAQKLATFLFQVRAYLETQLERCLVKQ